MIDLRLNYSRTKPILMGESSSTPKAGIAVKELKSGIENLKEQVKNSHLFFQKYVVPRFQELWLEKAKQNAISRVPGGQFLAKTLAIARGGAGRGVPFIRLVAKRNENHRIYLGARLFETGGTIRPNPDRPQPGGPPKYLAIPLYRGEIGELTWAAHMKSPQKRHIINGKPRAISYKSPQSWDKEDTFTAIVRKGRLAGKKVIFYKLGRNDAIPIFLLEESVDIKATYYASDALKEARRSISNILKEELVKNPIFVRNK